MKKRKGVNMVELLDCLAKAMEQALADGKSVAVARMDAETVARQVFGGERVYIPGYPKKMRAVQIARITTRSQVQISQATGLSVRQVRRIQRGK